MDVERISGLPGWKLARATAVAMVVYAVLRVVAFYTEIHAMESQGSFGYHRDGALLWWIAGTFIGVILAVMAGAAAWRVGEALRENTGYDNPAVVRTLRRYWTLIAVLAGLMLAQSVWGYGAVLLEKFL